MLRIRHLLEDSYQLATDNRMLAARTASAMIRSALRPYRPGDYPNPVATMWSLSFGRIELESPPATAVLRLCASLAPDANP